jgi:hypothetical protein
MKRSHKVVLMFMGTAAAGSLATMTVAQAFVPCDPLPGVFMPGDNGARCMYRGGFGGFGHRYAGHSHAYSHGG